MSDMSEIKSIMQYLNDKCTTEQAAEGADGTGLKAVHRLVFDHKKHIKKADSVKDLAKFYSDEKNILEIWDNLSECERDFVSYIVHYDGNEYLPTTIEYAKKYNFELTYKNIWGHEKSFLGDYRYSHSNLKFLSVLNKYIPKTKTVIFFPSGKDMPPFILKTLKKVVEPLKFEYSDYIGSERDYIIYRENRLEDFAALVRFAGSESLKVKKGTFEITKAKLTKMGEVIGFEEVCDNNGIFCTPQETKRGSDFKVAQPLFIIAANAKLLETDISGNVFPGEKSIELLDLPHSELAKKLFESYEYPNEICELDYVPYVGINNGNSSIKWHLCRESIIDALKNCPINKFIKFDDFEKYVKIFNGNFFRKLLINCSVVIKGYKFEDYYDYYGRRELDWEECEVQIIILILSFLSAIGMIDIAYTEKVTQIRDNTFCVGIAGFRITKLGAWILGMTDSYEASENTYIQNSEGELIIQPDYSVVISGLKTRIKYETYLSKFLTKISIDENAAIYKVDFPSIIRAFDIGITPQQVKTYLKKASSKSMPENVERSLNDWQAKAGRITIQNVTVIETDDKLLIEEIKHIKGMDKIIENDINNAVVIDEKNKKKIKKLIEKNGWIVKI